ncbi:hypothetical protein CCR83_11235 [Rhodobacter veldkampii DSM 11550]|uniref:RNA-binding protein n=1 Tax=Phaeovulum veldkampii DSM 11550 TaxID=1185920 RepID=A0A2T4JBF9_9RHOB|nr:RNA-binding S4 domain-containing protein [Phaeovulum veldkampii]MBK5946997.1 hypothetical protein [Phaeovulum veldkampii DSM 11550]PTE15158.1 RNA-binding protein [Phaeovulum veldkampii DSM 11550]TDQ55587.1 heat shock protein Hsp15 [Phaeovulum veldkampii DSM 11550]
MTEAADPDRVRLDKWLWHARVCKTRALSAELVGAGRVRLNGQPCAKPGRAVGPGDVLTLVQGGRVRVLRILAAGHRRGPAPEAAQLYAELAGLAEEAGAARTPQNDLSPGARLDCGGGGR